MEYYTLSRYAYWKYYILIFYYKLAEYPRPVRVWLIFGSICMLLLIMIVIGNALRTFAHYRFEHLVLHNRERYYERMKTVVSQARTLEPSEVSAILELPKNFKMKERQNRSFVPVLLELRREMSGTMSRPNWIRLTQALKMPAYFESQILSRSIRKKVQGFKDVADLDANLKEAVASRYLFTKNRKLQMHARLHAARFGTSYPFKVLEDDPNLVFTEEMVVKYHNVLGILRGSKYPNEYVISGSHLDAYDSATGAIDDGQGCSVNLESARLLATSGAKPKRSIVFSIWTAEEYGLLGSKYFVENKTVPLEKISNYFNRDGGPEVAVSVTVPPAMYDDFVQVCEPLSDINPEFPFEVLKRTAAPGPRPTTAGGSDHAYFAMNGVPTVSLGLRDVKGYGFNYREIWHTDLDLYNKCIPEYMEHSAVVQAVVLYGVANLDHLLSREGLYTN